MKPQPGRPPVVRRAHPADASAMARLHARSWRATYTDLLPNEVIDAVIASEPARGERWRTRLAEVGRPGGSFVADLDGSLLGFVFWEPSVYPGAGAGVAEVQAIYLDPNATGHGVGRTLLQAATDDAIAHGYGRAVLWVLAADDRARRFYERAGWHADGQTKVVERPGGSLHEVRYARLLESRRRP